jgi:hypothetical protein
MVAVVLGLAGRPRCGEDAMTTGRSLAEGFAEHVEALVDELVHIIATAPTDRWIRRPGEGEWSAAEVCGHIIEMMPFWAEQARAVVQSPGLRFGRAEDDPRRLGGVSANAAVDRHETVEKLRAATRTACATIRSLPDGAWTTEGLSITRGPMTVEAIISTLLVEHLQTHVDQVRRALGLP